MTEYQTREMQYQSELQNAGRQLEQANSELRQYEMVLMALQNRGMIMVDSNGRITIP